jgi:hypothetical protein
MDRFTYLQSISCLAIERVSAGEEGAAVELDEYREMNDGDDDCNSS